MLVASRKPTTKYTNILKDHVKNDDAIVICLNNSAYPKFDYILTTRTEVYYNAVSKGLNVIAPSNLSEDGRGNIKILSYKRWINIDDRTRDSATVIILNLLMVCDVKKVF